MKNFELGDKVSVLDEDINGVVLKIDQDKVTFETSDGFEMTYLAKELVKISSTNEISKFSTHHEILKSKQEKEINNKPKPTAEKKSKKEVFTLEVDLHIEKLVPSIKGLNNYDILTIQLDNAKRQIDFAIRNRIPKIVLIHGVGEGVLKSELEFFLKRYENITFQDANYQKYGNGAIEIYFIQKKL